MASNPKTTETQSPQTPGNTAHSNVEADKPEPYSIFDSRQKGLIVAIASIAATCKFLSFPPCIRLTHGSQRLREQYLLPRHSDYSQRSRCLDRANQPHCHLIPDIPSRCSQSMGPCIRRQRPTNSIHWHLYHLSGGVHRPRLDPQLCNAARPSMLTEYRQRQHDRYRVRRHWRCYYTR